MTSTENYLPEVEDVGLIAADSPKRRIQRAAIDLFLSQGYRGTSVKDITSACGLTQGALYNHFSSKEELLRSIITGTHAELEATLDRALVEAETGPAARLRALVRAFALFHERHRREALVSNLEYVELEGASFDDIVARRRGHRRLFETELHAGLDEGVFNLPVAEGIDEVKLAVTAIVNLAIRLSEIHGPFPHLPDEAIADFHADLALRTVTARAQESSA